MTRYVQVEVTGEHNVDGTWQEPIITRTRGEYHFQNGKHYVKYEDTETGITTKCLIKFTDTLMDVTKKGGHDSRMTFEKDKMNVTRYQTGQGILEMGMQATSIAMTEEKNRISCVVEYGLYAGGGKVQDSRVTLTLIPYPIL